MLKSANRPVSKLELVKWTFLLAKESENSSSSAFYQFLPYHYGPYSFTLQRELDALAQDGTLESTEKTWSLKGDVDDLKLPTNTQSDIRRLLEKFKHRNTNDLIDYVYHKYPGFTVNSKRQKLQQRTIATPAIYTAGYEGLHVDGFLNLLIENGIQRLIDVRNNPIARRFGFHKSTLSRLCGHVDIEYLHVPELGIRSEERQELNTQLDYDRLFDSYENTTLIRETAAIDRVTKLLAEKASVLVCMEAKACSCHRSRLGVRISGQTGLPLVHLEA